MNSESTQEIKDKCQKFRVLIIGRANAGKTTILHRVCDTTEEPEIYNKRGEKMDPLVLAACAGRGEHDIDNEMVFKTNPGFCFHDSRGFEAGGVLELDKVNAFITERSQRTKLEDRLHAIWYCIPVDDSRPFTAAENQFFSVCGTGSVPIIAVFTKFDALDNKAFATLRRENLSRADAKREAPGRATAEFERMHLDTLYAQPYPPKGHAYLRDMDKPGANCSELIEQTTDALDSEVMQQLLVSTQRNNLELCIKYALERKLIPAIIQRIERNLAPSPFAESVTEGEAGWVALMIFLWFPHISGVANPRLRGNDLLMDGNDDRGLRVHMARYYPQIYESFTAIIKSSLPAVQMILLGLGATISAEHSYFLWDQSGSVDAVTDAVRSYAASPQCQAVARAVEEIDVTKSSLERDTAKWKTETLQKLMQIARDNRLPA